MSEHGFVFHAGSGHASYRWRYGRAAVRLVQSKETAGVKLLTARRLAHTRAPCVAYWNIAPGLAFDPGAGQRPPQGLTR